MLTLDTIYKANFVLKEVVRKTDLLYTPAISSNNEVYVKCENLQITGSFKVRGAYYKISTLSNEDKAKGVIACSAGNHAQGVALASTKNGVKAQIYIPSLAPISKIEATKKYGAEVIPVDGVYDDAYAAAKKAVDETGAIFVHPFNDPDVIAGQGTIGLEIMEQIPDADAVVIPIGGGGLAAGVAFTIKQLNPKCKVYGVQAAGAPSMYNWIAKKDKTPLDKVSTFADGIAVKCPGDLTYELCNEYLDDIFVVSEDEIATAILTLMESQKLVAEGAGAVAVAAVMANKIPEKNKKVVCLLSGGNIDVTILSKVIQRGLLSAGRLSDITIELVDKPGQLQDVAEIIASMKANVVRVNHNHGGQDTDVNGCYLEIAMETRNFEHLEEIKKELISNGYTIIK